MQVTSLTATRIAALLAPLISDIEVVSGDLVITRENGTVANLGALGSNADTKGQILLWSCGDGAIEVKTYEHRFRTQTDPIQILGVSAATGFGFAPTGSDIILDLVTATDEVSLWSGNPANRPRIVAGQQETAAEAVPGNPIINANTSMRVKCLQKGSTLPGSFVTVFIRWKWYVA